MPTRQTATGKSRTRIRKQADHLRAIAGRLEDELSHLEERMGRLEDAGMWTALEEEETAYHALEDVLRQVETAAASIEDMWKDA